MDKNEVMDAINSMKSALSEIEKKYTQVQDGSPEKKDGNMGNAEDGVESYSKFEQNDKKAMMIKALKG